MPIHVELLVASETGPTAVQRFVQRLRREADAKTDPKATRFDTGQATHSRAAKPAAESPPRIAELGIVPLPQTPFIPAPEAERSRVVAFVRSMLTSDLHFRFCKVRRATVANFAALDPEVLVWVEGDSDCGGNRLVWLTRGSPWTYDYTYNQFGDLDDIIAKIKERSLTEITF